MKLVRIICVVLSAISANAGVLPVEKCSLEDSTCMKDAVQKAVPIFTAGIPDLGIGALDVMDMDDFTFDLSGLQFGLQNGKLKGLKNAVIETVKWDLKKKHFDIDFHVDCTVKGHYTAGGRILILPITGDGQMKLTLKKIQIRLRFFYEMEKDADGKEHVAPKKLTTEFDVKENAHFHLTNLFNGNKELGDQMLIFLNDNWKEISQEFGRPILDVAAKKIFKSIVKFFKKQSIEDIANV